MTTLDPNANIADTYKGLRSTKEIHSCPCCGEKEVAERREWNRHCNGHWNTSVSFRCGSKLVFVPNFMRVCVEHLCRKDPAWQERVKKVDFLRGKLVEVAQEYGADPKDVNSLRDKLEYWNPRYHP